MKWLLKSAEGGYALAMVEVGFMYLTGTGVAMNAEVGIRWLRKAAKLGNDVAKEQLKQLRKDE